MSTRPLTVEPVAKVLKALMLLLALDAVLGNRALNAAVKLVLPIKPPPLERIWMELTSWALLPLSCTSPVDVLTSSSMALDATAGAMSPAVTPPPLVSFWAGATREAVEEANTTGDL